MTHQQLQTIDADTLLSTTLPPTRFIIDRLLPQGLHILAGAPKVGKSWLALWLCLQVAQGTSVWDFPTHRGTVLYLCLEDSLTRIQSRLFQITDDAPEALHFATLAAGIGEGLEEQLTNFLTQHPDTSLVVIDTLQRIRTGSDSGTPYANDYRDISVLKALADKHHIAILLIHHLRTIRPLRTLFTQQMKPALTLATMHLPESTSMTMWTWILWSRCSCCRSWR